MTASAQQLADYLDRRIAWPRDQVPRYLPRYDADPWGERPDASELAADAEFQSMRLATWSTTDQGQLITSALEAVSPPFLHHDERLLAEALSLAVQMQAEGKRQQAGQVALVATAAAILVAALWLLGE
jgi:hypothetical protein